MTDPSSLEQGLTLSAAIRRYSDPETWVAYIAIRKKNSGGRTVANGITRDEPLEVYHGRISQGLRALRQDKHKETRIWMELLQAFLGRLRRGEIVAYGYPKPRSVSVVDRLPIPPDLWHDRPEIDWRRSKTAGNGLSFVSVRILESQTDERSAVDPGRNDGPGRPTLRPYIMAEFRRRANADELEKTLARQARVLRAWVKRAHPEKAPPQVRSIENMIRAEYREIVPLPHSGKRIQ